MITKKKLPQFEGWLRAAGCEIMPLTSEYELLRFRATLGTGVVYTGKRGISPSAEWVKEAFECFLTASKWRGKGKPTKRIGGSKLKRQIFDRDGSDCFYCGGVMDVKEATLEHLVPVNQKGSNTLSNCVLACEPCNNLAGHKSLVEKIQLRDEIRSGF